MSSCVEILNKLLYAASEEEDAASKGAYYCTCLDLILEAGRLDSMVCMVDHRFVMTPLRLSRKGLG